ncbi:hypothetical protein, partial [Lacticaseibacillus rhamnosus]|uniref:hypothetical protein n=1 Tax=Lacticaseibacillus rhamnosus TaxID=47715 RepID=UPI003F45DEB1
RSVIDDPRRPAAWSGATIAGGVISLLLIWEGRLGVVTALGIVAAIVLGGLIAGRRRAQPPTRPVAGAPRHAGAEALLAHIPDPV